MLLPSITLHASTPLRELSLPLMSRIPLSLRRRQCRSPVNPVVHCFARLAVEQTAGPRGDSLGLDTRKSAGPREDSVGFNARQASGPAWRLHRLRRRHVHQEYSPPASSAVQCTPARTTSHYGGFQQLPDVEDTRKANYVHQQFAGRRFTGALFQSVDLLLRDHASTIHPGAETGVLHEFTLKPGSYVCSEPVRPRHDARRSLRAPEARVRQRLTSPSG